MAVVYVVNVDILDVGGQVYRTDRGTWVVQGWSVTDPEALARMDIPAGEGAVEIPDRMIQFFSEEDRDPGDGRAVQ